MKSLVSFLFLMCFSLTTVWAQAPAKELYDVVNPNTPLVGPGCVIDNIKGASGDNMSYITDGDLTNAGTFTTVLNLISDVYFASVKDVNYYYPAGVRVGFVIEPASGVNLLSGFTINLYKDNALVIAATGSELTLEAMPIWESGKAQRISLIAPGDFDEVELIQTGVSLASTIGIHYAYVEPAGSNYNCTTLLNLPTGNIAANVTYLLLPVNTISNAPYIFDGDPATASHLNVTALGEATFTITLPAAYPAKTYFGFVTNNSSLLDIGSDGNLINTFHIRAYNGNTLVADENLSNLLRITLEDGHIQYGLIAQSPFNKIELYANITLFGTMDIYSALIITDADGDGFPDCVDTACPTGSNNLDYNGNGIADACDVPCLINLGQNVTLCGTQSSLDLNATFGSGLTWTILPESSGTATINGNNLEIISNVGIFYLQASNGTCTDIAVVTKKAMLAEELCKVPMVGNTFETFSPDGSCLICVGGEAPTGNADYIIDTNLSNYAEVTPEVLGLFSTDPIIGVRNTVKTYPVNTRVGFIVQPAGGLLNVDLFENFTIKTYLNGIEQQTVNSSDFILSADLIETNGAQTQRISFIAQQEFDAVALFSTNVLGADLFSSDLRIYYAYTESPDCVTSVSGCNEPLTVNGPYKAQLQPDRTSIETLLDLSLLPGVSDDSHMEDLGYLFDDDLTNYAIIYPSTLEAGSLATISVKIDKSIPAGSNNTVGFIISKTGVSLLAVDAFANMTVNTYLNGVLQESSNESGKVLDLALLDLNSEQSEITFIPTNEFDEIQLSLTTLVSADVVGSNLTYVYGAFIRQDSDFDGVPDCIDICCGDDNLDANGDGIPDGCAVLIGSNNRQVPVLLVRLKCLLQDPVYRMI